MIKSINDVYREKIVELSDGKKIINYLKKLNIHKQQYIANLMLSDLYKIKIYNAVNNGEKQVKIELSNKEKLFFECIEATKAFNSLDLITKIFLMKMIDVESLDMKLTSINPLHSLDKSIYTFSYDLELFKEYYIDYITKNPNDDYFIIDVLVDEINSLKEINYEKYQKFILEFLRGFYKIYIYGDANYNRNYNNYLHEINTMKLDEILDKIKNDITFLTDILEEWLKYSTSQNKNDIDKYFINNRDENIKKKLKFKGE